MSDANLASIAKIREATLGNAGVNPKLREVPITAESLTYAGENVQSATIRSDRQVPDSVKVGGQPQGGYNFELMYAEYVASIDVILHNDWSITNLTGTFNLTVSNQRITGVAEQFDNAVIGGLLLVGGASAPGNNGKKRVVAKAEDGSWVQLAAGSIVSDQSGASLTVRGKTITNGVTRKSDTYEKRIVNNLGVDYFQQYLGMVGDTHELRVESKRVVTGSFGFVGTDYDISDVSISADATSLTAATGLLTFTGQPTADDTVTIGATVYTWKVAPANDYDVEIGATQADSVQNLIDEINGDGVSDAHPTVEAELDGANLRVTAKTDGPGGNSIATLESGANTAWGGATLADGAAEAPDYDPPLESDIMNGANNMGTIMMDGAAATDKFRLITINLANNLRGKDALSVVGNWDVGMGTVAVTGTLSAYFTNNLLPTKIKNNTSFALAFYLRDVDGNELHFYLPNVKSGQGDPQITAINTDVMIEAQFTAIKERGGSNKTIIIDALDTVPAP